MNTVTETANAQSLVLWESSSGTPPATNVAIAGDFAPSESLVFPADCGWTEMAGSVAGHFKDVAATFLNLEAVIDAEGLMRRGGNPASGSRSASGVALDYLEAIQTRAVAIANDHIYDFGRAGVERTRNILLKRNLVPLGAGKTLRKAPQAWIWRGPGEIRVGFWAAAISTNHPATRKTEGVDMANLDRALYALECMRYHQATFCVALIHTERDGTNHPRAVEVALMESLAKWGFDLVCESNSGRISGAKFVEGHREGPSYCFYGLGNLVSGHAEGALEKEGLIVVAGLNESGAMTRLEVRPVLLGETGFAEIPSAERGQKILERFQNLSDAMIDGSYEWSRGRDNVRRFARFPVPNDSIDRPLFEPKKRLLRMRQLMRKIIG